MFTLPVNQISLGPSQPSPACEHKMAPILLGADFRHTRGGVVDGVVGGVVLHVFWDGKKKEENNLS